MVKRALHANRDGEAGQGICPALAFWTGNNLRLSEEIEAVPHHVPGPAGADFQQRTRHLDIVGLGEAACDVEGATKRVEGGLGAGTLVQIRHLAGTEARDQLGQVNAFDRAIADVDAAPAGKRPPDFIPSTTCTAQLQRDLGAASEQVEPGDAVKKRLRRDAVERKIAGEGWDLLRGIERELAGALSIIELSAS